MSLILKAGSIGKYAWHFRVSGIGHGLAKTDVLSQFLRYSLAHLNSEELTEAMEWYVQHS